MNTIQRRNRSSCHSIEGLREEVRMLFGRTKHHHTKVYGVSRFKTF